MHSSLFSSCHRHRPHFVHLKHYLSLVSLGFRIPLFSSTSKLCFSSIASYCLLFEQLSGLVVFLFLKFPFNLKDVWESMKLHIISYLYQYRTATGKLLDCIGITTRKWHTHLHWKWKTITCYLILISNYLISELICSKSSFFSSFTL